MYIYATVIISNMQSDENESMKSANQSAQKLRLDEPIDDLRDGKQPLVASQDTDSDRKSLLHTPEDSNTKIIILVIAAICILAVFGVVIYLIWFRNERDTQMIQALIPQPFTESNEFMHFVLGNGLKVLLVQPGSALKNSFICKIISSNRWLWVRKRSKRLCWLYTSDSEFTFFWFEKLSRFSSNRQNCEQIPRKTKRSDKSLFDKFYVSHRRSRA